MQLNQAPAPGARVLIRDEEWIIQNADMCALGGWQLRCIGVSETVRNRHGLFLTQLEDVTLIDPAKTELVCDDSPTFVAARLYIEARLRQSALQNDAVVLGHHGVMDALPFQLEPAHRMLGQLRPRLPDCRHRGPGQDARSRHSERRTDAPRQGPAHAGGHHQKHDAARSSKSSGTASPSR